MASTKEFLEFVLEQIDAPDDVMCRQMMGEYLLYWQGVHFGGIYDNRLLVKKSTATVQFNMPEAIPYEGAKAMYQVNVDEREEVKRVVAAIVLGMK
ncbi:MAG: competence protein TfoX [Bacteroidales bacterium]